MKATLPTFLLLALAATSAPAAVVTIESDTSTERETTGYWLYSSITGNSSADFGDATNGKSFVVLEGDVFGGAGNVSRANDGIAQTNQDQVANTFFFIDGSDGRIQMDLGATMAVTMINSFSWHTGSRTPQNYTVYGATAPSKSAPDFTAAGFRNDAGLAGLGYTKIADVGPTSGNNAQVGVNITDIGDYRYILFDIDQPTGSGVGTFFGEIDIYAVPEPSSLLLAALGGLLITRRRRD